MSPARRAASAASSVGTVSGEELCGLGSSFDAAAVPLSERCAGEQRGGFLEVVQVSEVTDVEASQFHSSLSPTGQPGRHGRGRVRPHCMQGVPVWLCVRVCGVCVVRVWMWCVCCSCGICGCECYVWCGCGVCGVLCVCGCVCVYRVRRVCGMWSACSPRPAHPTSIRARSIVIKIHNCPVSKGPARGVKGLQDARVSFRLQRRAV